jgi:hypothetical protein
MSDYVTTSLEQFRRGGIDPDAYFLISTSQGVYAHAAPSAAEALRLLVEQHPEIDPLACRVRSLREELEGVARYEHLPKEEQVAAMFQDSLDEARRLQQDRERLKHGRIQ